MRSFVKYCFHNSKISHIFAPPCNILSIYYSTSELKGIYSGFQLLIGVPAELKQPQRPKKAGEQGEKASRLKITTLQVYQAFYRTISLPSNTRQRPSFYLISELRYSP